VQNLSARIIAAACFAATQSNPPHQSPGKPKAAARHPDAALIELREKRGRERHGKISGCVS
jgi:hypothetical protein